MAPVPGASKYTGRPGLSGLSNLYTGPDSAASIRRTRVLHIDRNDIEQWTQSLPDGGGVGEFVAL